MKLSTCTTALAFGLLAGACAPDDHDHGHAEHDEHGEETPHAPDSVHLTEAQLASAGVRVERAGPGEIARTMTLPAEVAANADAVTHVNPKAPGTVRSIHKRLGEEVLEGELLCVVDSVDLGAAVAAFVRARALVGAAVGTLAREEELFERRIETAGRVLEAAVEADRRIHARERELLEKAVSTARASLEADRALLSSELARDREMTELRAERDARLQALEVELIERRIEEDAARHRLLAFGVDADAIEGLEAGSPLAAGTYAIHAPRGGVVAARHISAGEYVDGATKLYTLEDLSLVWVLASAFEQETRALGVGQRGEIRLDAFPGRAFEAEVAQIGFAVDPASRSLTVRLELQNPEIPDWSEPYPLRPGMFGRVDLVVETHAARVLLPESALVHEDAGDFVFVRMEDGAFRRRPVEVGRASGKTVEIASGVEPGEEVAVEGTFLLKSALRREELGGGHGH